MNKHPGADLAQAIKMIKLGLSSLEKLHKEGLKAPDKKRRAWVAEGDLITGMRLLKSFIERKKF
jgi:hypothetical protein